ncbi:PAS domain S-box [Halobacteroides halobius DSM 5150]|uniref:histidine kinase n=1 Tax=Halobacteroides halobius (strain ATCC 35273 / DSM 5150 / MD-1) TaxID=748449 RepID=L0KCB8_HALHC|nr:PAS domain-containing sensor histidine kinase [Halobacteroides halobius]AGB42019.1 PAS domain S-box [Halobacteroides halobius DSM 5150]
MQKSIYQNIDCQTKLYRTIFEKTGVAILVVEEDTTISMVNQAVEQLAGYSKSEIEGEMKLVDFIADKEDLEQILSYHYKRRLDKGNIPNKYEFELIDKQGNSKVVLSQVEMIPNTACSIVSLSDITKQKKLKEELNQNKRKEVIFSNISHDLKSPLNLILSSVQVLNMFSENNLEQKNIEKINGYTHTIRQNSYRLLKLVNDLVDLTKISANSYDVNLENHNIVEVVNLIVQSIKDYIQDQNKSFEFNKKEDYKLIACDPFSIERIILNLVSNTVKYTTEGDQIAITIDSNGNEVIISVKDTGAGMKNSDQQKIFNRFKQVNESELASKNNFNNGVGLSLVKSLVDLHQGSIEVKSEYGKGSEFIIYLPDKRIANCGKSNDSYNKQGLVERLKVEFADIYY